MLIWFLPFLLRHDLFKAMGTNRKYKLDTFVSMYNHFNYCSEENTEHFRYPRSPFLHPVWSQHPFPFLDLYYHWLLLCGFEFHVNGIIQSSFECGFFCFTLCRDICPFCTCNNSSFFVIAGPLGTSPFMCSLPLPISPFSSSVHHHAHYSMFLTHSTALVP